MVRDVEILSSWTGFNILYLPTWFNQATVLTFIIITGLERFSPWHWLNDITRIFGLWFRFFSSSWSGAQHSKGLVGKCALSWQSVVPSGTCYGFARLLSTQQTQQLGSTRYRVSGHALRMSNGRITNVCVQTPSDHVRSLHAAGFTFYLRLSCVLLKTLRIFTYTFT